MKRGQVCWFDPSSPPEGYTETKTAKYFKLVKFVMETTLKDLAFSSFTKFSSFLISFIPTKVEIKSINEVLNYYEDGTVVSSTHHTQHHTSKRPLFETDLMRIMDDSAFSYTAPIANFSQTVLNIFCKMLDEL
jgi:hypothetical protein